MGSNICSSRQRSESFLCLRDTHIPISAKYLTVGFVMATSEQMKKMNVTSVEAKDGSGSLVTLDVFHQLHCLVRLPPYIDHSGLSLLT
jgi:hypothetical protein